jgi:hypothetical protein
MDCSQCSKSPFFIYILYVKSSSHNQKAKMSIRIGIKLDCKYCILSVFSFFSLRLLLLCSSNLSARSSIKKLIYTLMFHSQDIFFSISFGIVELFMIDRILP